MQLPFSREQFLDVFGAYNQALWPAALLLWLATAFMVVRLIRRGPGASRALSALLAVHWAWAGLAYHVAYFRGINPLAAIFGAAFVLQAALFVGRGIMSPSLRYEPRDSAWSRLGIGLMVYALLYPALGLASGLAYPRMPIFGVPCPTTLLTAGALMLVRSSAVRALAIIPLLWSMIGGSSAFLLGVPADLMLTVAAILLLVHVVRPRRHALAHAA